MTKNDAAKIRRQVRLLQHELEKLNQYTKGCFGMGLHGENIANQLSAIVSLIEPECPVKVGRVKRRQRSTPKLRRLVKSLRNDFIASGGKVSVSVYRSDYERLLDYAAQCLENDR